MHTRASAFFAFVIAVVAMQTVRARKMGPRTGSMPKRWRPRLNAYYERRGWPAPYGESGDRLDWWRPVEGTTSRTDDTVARLTRPAINVVVWVGVAVVALWFITKR